MSAQREWHTAAIVYAQKVRSVCLNLWLMSGIDCALLLFARSRTQSNRSEDL